MAAPTLCMPLHIIARPEKLPSHKPKAATVQVSKAVPSTYSQYVVDEINTYVAIRDLRVAEAERSPTAENLRQATLTNDFVETCLQRPQVVYAAQHLPETQAAFERERCAVVKARLSELHVKST